MLAISLTTECRSVRSRKCQCGLSPMLRILLRVVWSMPANNIKAKGSEAHSLRQLICGNDLSPQASHGLLSDEKFERWSEEDAERVHSLLSELSPSQLRAFDEMRYSQYPLVFVQGPFGTGKTENISTFLQIATIIRLSWMGCAPSNPVVELLVTEMERACPEMGAIRFYSLASEARALRRSERQFAVELDLDRNDKEGSEDNYIVPIEEDAEDGKLFNAFMIDLTTKPQLWNPTRKERPNLKSMGLNIHALQNASVLDHKVLHSIMNLRIPTSNSARVSMHKTLRIPKQPRTTRIRSTNSFWIRCDVLEASLLPCPIVPTSFSWKPRRSSWSL